MSETVNGLTERQGIYLLSHSVGLPLPNAERAAAKAFWTPWETGNGDIWQHWLGTIEAFRAELALLIARIVKKPAQTLRHAQSR